MSLIPFKRSGRGALDSLRRRQPWARRLDVEELEPRRLLSVNVLTYHNDLTRQGLNSAEASLTPANVNSSAFGKLFSYPVLGQIYAEPLYVSNLAIPGQGIRNVVFVATEHNDVYAFDATSNAGPNGGLLWSVNLGQSASMPNPFFGNRYGPYGDIKPQVGITSTPVIDLATNTIYIDSFTNDVIGQNAYSHHIWALDITTGAQKAAPALVAAAVQGNGAGSVGGTINFTATQQIQRSALTLLGGTLYVAYAGYADTDPYTGWVLGFDPATLQLTKVFNTAPNDGTDSHEGEAGIWQGGYGMASDGAQLFVMTGNGDFQTNIGDYGDSFLKLTPDNSTQPGNKNGYGLTASDYFTPFNEQSLADADTDLGSGGTMILPDQEGSRPHLLVGAGKQGVIYLINRDAGQMGKFNSGFDNVVQKVSMGHSEFGGPAYFNNTIYYHANGDVLKAFSIVNGVLSAAPVAQGSTSYSFPGATPSVSSAGTANGIVWDVQYNSSRAVLRAYNAATLAELYNSSQNVARDGLRPGVKFVTPMIADGHVFVGTDGALAVFGLLSPPVTAPAAPTGLSASNSTAMQIRLTWTDHATNESAFEIERSSDGMNYVQIALASVNSTSFVDTGVVADATYFYRVRATNTVGDSTAAGPVSSTVVPIATPVNVYHFEEGADLTTLDSAGGNTGTLVGGTTPAWTAGRIGNGALSFSGDGVTNSTTPQSAVQTASSLAGALGGTATLTAWVKTTQTGNNTLTSAPAIAGVDVAGSTNDVRWGYLDAAGHIGLGAGSTGIVSNGVVNDGQWHHVAMTRNQSTGAVQIYVDGALQGSGTGATGTKTTAFRLIGAQTALASDGVTSLGATYFNGQLDDLRIFNRVLTATEIAAIGKVPAAPVNLTANALSSSMVQLAWTNASSFAENVEVQRKIGAGGAYQQIALLGGAATGFTDTNLSPGTEYFYRVRASGLAGASDFSIPTSVTPPRPTVVGRFVFYNKSSFDGENGSSNIADNLAIAPDKQALLPGQTATFANYTSYSKGLNGVIVDVSNFDGVITPSDFTLMVGSTSDVGAWSPAPEPSFVAMYPGWGVGGSTRLELLWDNNLIQNQWLQVTLEANDVTDLAAPDVFYFGNAIGESGNLPGSTMVDTADELGARSNGTAAGEAGLGNLYDYNRDKQVNSEDELIARSHRSGLSPLRLITTPATVVASAASSGAALSAAVARAEARPAASELGAAWIVSPELNSVPSSAKAKAIDAALQDFYAKTTSITRPSFRPDAAPPIQAQRTDSAGHGLQDPHDASFSQETDGTGDSTGWRFSSSLRGLRRFGRWLPALVLLLAGRIRTSGPRASWLATICLSANTANQVISIYVTGGEAIAGEDFFAQIGDGGAFLGGVNSKPSFTNVDVIAGSVFAGNNNGAFGDPNGVGPPGSNAAHPLIWLDGTTTVSGTTPASGLLATLTLDTTGLSSGTFPLVLTGVASARARLTRRCGTRWGVPFRWR